VNAVQSISSQQSRGKKKNKGKSKKYSNQQESKNTQDPNVGGKNKRKVKYPCMVCKEDHFTKDFPHLARFINTSSEGDLLPNQWY
jgi:hypothetical protein